MATATGCRDGYEVSVGSDPASAGSQPFDFSGSIGLHFLAQRPDSIALGPWERVGVVPAPHWNASDRQPVWPPGTPDPLTGSTSGLTDGSGTPTSAAASWSFGYAGTGIHPGPGDPRLLNSGLGTDQPYGPDVPAEVTLSGIPFTSYDLIVYLGGPWRYHRASVRLDSDPASLSYLLTFAGPPFLGWREAAATTEGDIVEANYVRFRGLGGPSQTVILEQLDNDSVAIHGVQIIDMAADADGDGIPDAVEIEHGLDPAVSDAAADPDGDGLGNADELAAGTDPHRTDSDDDGLRDGDELNGEPFPSLPTLADSDGDGRDDAVERAGGTDPMNPADSAPGVPVWTAATRTWHWQVDDLRVLWNHARSPMAGRRSEIFDLVTELDDSGWASAVRMGLFYREGVLTYRFRCIQDVFHQDGHPTWAFYGTGSTQPQNDLKQALGFSGFGEADDSLPLRFVFTAVQPDPGQNLWTLDFALYQTADPLNPVLVGSETWTNAVAADARLLDGSAPWTDTDGNPGVPSFDNEPGVEAYITRDPLGPPDGDNDGMPDDWETTHALNASDPSDATLDPDGDGVINRDECFAGTDPNDDDGVDDGEELRQGSSPVDSDSIPAWFHFSGTPDDLDGDGVDGWVELEFLASSTSSADSSGQPSERAGQPALSGDARALLEKLSTGSYPGSPQPGVPSPSQAARFLMQASFGPTPEAIEQVRELGYEAWIDEQLAMPALP